MSPEQEDYFWLVSMDQMINVANYSGIVQMFMGIIIEMITCLFLRSVFIFDKQGLQWTKLSPIEWIFMTLGPITLILYGVRYLGGVDDANGVYAFFIYVLLDPISLFVYASLTTSIICSVEEFKQGFESLNSSLQNSSKVKSSNATKSSATK
jgi:hypothetical protein